MKLDAFLAALHKVRQTATGEWVACCPAHEDRNPSLSVKDNGDGRILVKCFAGCTAEEIVRAVGMRLSDLMPDRALGHRLKRVPFNSRTVLSALEWQATIVSIAASDLAQGKSLSQSDTALLWETAGAIAEAVEYARR